MRRHIVRGKSSGANRAAVFVFGLILSGLSVCVVGSAASSSDGGDKADVSLQHGVKVTDFSLEGRIHGENITFTLSLAATPGERGMTLPLVVGDVAYLGGELPGKSELVRAGDTYSLVMKSARTQAVVFSFAGKAVRDGDWRRTAFAIPASSVRKLSVLCDRNDLEVRFPGALDVNRSVAPDGKTMVTAFLGIAGDFEVRWKPEVRKLESDLVAMSEANTIATASVGALRIDTILTYRVVQGSLDKLILDLPDVNVTQVRGEDIQDWRIDKTTDPEHPRLIVALSRPSDEVYRLQVESEMAIPKFPCQFDLPVITPENTIRASGFLVVGTDSAIKLQVNKVAGLTQVDQGAFPAITLDAKAQRPRSIPKRSAYAYQYASMPYRLTLNADDIVSSLIADERLVLLLTDNDLVFSASVELDIKDAPAREITIETDPAADWTVTSIDGRHVADADTDVREEPIPGDAGKGRRRIIYVPFKQAVMGVTLVEIRMEKSLKPGTTAYSAPIFKVSDAKSERGYLMLAAEQGVRLKAENAFGLREVHTGSAPMKAAGAQQAFRFKESGWKVDLSIERAEPSLYAEALHLFSLGENVVYCSAAITYHIGGAPLQDLRVGVPPEIETVEFVGADIEGWTRDGDVCVVRLQNKIMGDYTLLVTYDRQFPQDVYEFSAGGIETIGAKSEVGYIVFASSASLRLPEAKPLPDSVFKIDREEIPPAYASPISDPIIGAYKYVRAPHVVAVRVEPYETGQLLGQVADYVKLDTRLSKDGEAITTAAYYVKNASRQHFVVSLPKNAELWTIKRIDDRGHREDVLSQENEGRLLIPISRPPDPNAAISIELTYAESHGDLGFWRSGVRGVRLSAPFFSETHATFTGWEIHVHDDFTIAGSGGNMTRELAASRGVLWSVIKKTLDMFGAILDGPGKRGFWSALTTGYGGNTSEIFTKSLGLSGAQPPSVALIVVPDWMGQESSARLMVVLTVLGAAVLGAVGAAGRRLPWLPAVAATLITCGMAESAVGRSILASVLFLAVVYVFSALMFKTGFRLIARCFRLIMVEGLWRFLKAANRCFRRSRKNGGACEENRSAAETDEACAAPFEPDGQNSSGDAQGGISGRDGYTTISLSVVSLLLGLFAASVVGEPADRGAGSDVKEPGRPGPIMDSLTMIIEAPGTGRDIEKSAAVTRVVEFSADGPESFVLAPPTSVLVGFDLGSRNLEITSRQEGYVLHVKKGGNYRVTAKTVEPVVEQNGAWNLSVHILENIKNDIKLTIPESGLDVSSDEAVLFDTLETTNSTVVEAVFGAVRTANFRWRPRMRKTKLEEAVFFCEVNTFVALQSGVVDLSHLIHYQIAQGEIKELKMRVPENMSVTAVQGAGVATWSFDPVDRLLEAVLEKPASGAYTLTVTTQTASDGLPYRVELGALSVVGASRQRGATAIAAPESVQVRVDEAEGLNPMNIEDFPQIAAAADQLLTQRIASAAIRRAYRYHQPEDVSVIVHADRVPPEIRVVENGTLTISDERTVLVTSLGLSVLKSGVFSVTLEIPRDFDVETLSGPDVSHWDEIKGDAHGVVVYFNKQVMEATEINLVVAGTEKGIESRMNAPRIALKDASKHTGRLVISSERGIRIMIESHTGVDVKKASEEGVAQTGVLVFDLLRPTWSITLKTEVLTPLVKPEALQWVDLTEGMLQCRAYLVYRIENAGVKSFKFKAPSPGLTMSFSGRNIARVHETDKENGIWQVDLHGKVENLFNMTASYQAQYVPTEQKVKILPLQTVDTDGMRGYLVVTCGGRVQVKREGELQGLKIEDPRNIPPIFGAGDLSSAILCYRTARPDYELDLSVVRHDPAQVLPANVNSVRMTSVLSPDKKVLTRAILSMAVGDLRFLKMALPGKNDMLWTALVNGREVSVSRDGGMYCLPLEQQQAEQDTIVDLTYAGSALNPHGFRQKYLAPIFTGLPLKDIEWSFYVMPGIDYYGFGGTMEYCRDENPRMKTFDAANYQAYNEKLRESSIRMAREVLDAGDDLARAGKQKRARQAFQQALNYSMGQADLNEDARVQLRNLTKRQVKIGLVDRRNALRVSNNIQGDQQVALIKELGDGDYTEEYAVNVEKALSSRDNSALDLVADKMIEQQAAAAGVVKAINVTIPEHGRLLRFYRALQIDPKGEISVSFRAGRGRLLEIAKAFAPALFLFLCYWRLLVIRMESNH